MEDRFFAPHAYYWQCRRASHVPLTKRGALLRSAAIANSKRWKSCYVGNSVQASAATKLGRRAHVLRTSDCQAPAISQDAPGECFLIGAAGPASCYESARLRYRQGLDSSRKNAADWLPDPLFAIAFARAGRF